MKENNKMQHKKIYLCELIMTYIIRLIENYYLKPTVKGKNNFNIKINRSNLTKGVYQHILYNILTGTINDIQLDEFCRSYIISIKNDKNRSFPRNSNTPFTKWYIKGYSDQTKYSKIIDAMINNKINELNKNLKSFAKNIISIDGKKYG